MSASPSAGHVGSIGRESVGGAMWISTPWHLETPSLPVPYPRRHRSCPHHPRTKHPSSQDVGVRGLFHARILAASTAVVFPLPRRYKTLWLFPSPASYIRLVCGGLFACVILDCYQGLFSCSDGVAVAGSEGTLMMGESASFVFRVLSHVGE